MKFEEHTALKAPQLKNDNIYLRPTRLSDYEAVKEYRQNIDNCRYIRPPDTDEEVYRIVGELSKSWKLTQGVWNGLVICLSDDDTAVGEIVFRVEDWQHQRAELGYRLSDTVAGKGVCTQAAHLLINYLFHEIGFFKVAAKCDPRNIASYKVMEKLGFKREAFFKGHYLMGNEWTDQYDYGLLASEWKKK